jgi:hypothetical protein
MPAASDPAWRQLLTAAQQDVLLWRLAGKRHSTSAGMGAPSRKGSLATLRGRPEPRATQSSQFGPGESASPSGSPGQSMSVSVTLNMNLYMHVLPSMQRAAAEEMEALFARGLRPTGEN